MSSYTFDGYNRLQQSVAHLCEAASRLHTALTETASSRGDTARELTLLAAKARILSSATITELAHAFITPLERRDLARLSQQLLKATVHLSRVPAEAGDRADLAAYTGGIASSVAKLKPLFERLREFRRPDALLRMVDDYQKTLWATRCPPKASTHFPGPPPALLLCFDALDDLTYMLQEALVANA